MAELLATELNAEMALLGRRIKQGREFRSLTLHDLARQAEVGVQTLVRIEAGNTNVGALNLQRVMRVLGMSPTLVAAPLTAQTPMHARSIQTREATKALKDAARAACTTLDTWLQTAGASRLSGSTFEQLLQEHLVALLAGQPGAVGLTEGLPPQLYTPRAVGGPLTLEESETPQCLGWVLKVRGDDVILQGGRAMPLVLTRESIVPYQSREAAVEACLRFVDKTGHPPGAVDALPVFPGDPLDQRTGRIVVS